MSWNGQTHFKNLAANDHFTTLQSKGLSKKSDYWKALGWNEISRRDTLKGTYNIFQTCWTHSTTCKASEKYAGG